MSNSEANATINERAAEEFYRKGVEAQQQGNEEKAAEFFERALRENPDHEGACFALAKFYDRHADDTRAIELYERLCAGGGVPANALINLAVLYEDNNHYEEARRCLQAVLNSNPNHARARLYLKDVESARSMFVEDDGREDRRNAVLDTPITDFELSVRSRNCLKKMNIRVLGDLLRVSEAELLSYKNFGETSLNEIRSLLASKGLRLGQALEESKPGAVAAAPVRTIPPEIADVPNEVLSRRIEDMELSVRSRKALQRLNIATIGELAARTEAELLGCKNFGQTSLAEIKQMLAQFGLSLRKLED